MYDWKLFKNMEKKLCIPICSSIFFIDLKMLYWYLARSPSPVLRKTEEEKQREREEAQADKERKETERKIRKKEMQYQVNNYLI